VAGDDATVRLAEVVAPLPPRLDVRPGDGQGYRVEALQRGGPFRVLPQTATAFRQFADLLDARDALRSELTVQDAADLAFALLSTEVYVLLTTTRGRTPEEWERWMTAVLAATLLA
jgi:hypothetical protein